MLCVTRRPASPSAADLSRRAQACMPSLTLLLFGNPRRLQFPTFLRKKNQLPSINYWSLSPPWRLACPCTIARTPTRPSLLPRQSHSLGTSQSTWPQLCSSVSGNEGQFLISPFFSALQINAKLVSSSHAPANGTLNGASGEARWSDKNARFLCRPRSSSLGLRVLENPEPRMRIVPR